MRSYRDVEEGSAVASLRTSSTSRRSAGLSSAPAGTSRRPTTTLSKDPETVNGSCFSIEPGVYRREYGMRSEINAYVQDAELVISGGAPQQAVLLP